jgi:type IV pilus assembly protein PilN
MTTRVNLLPWREMQRKEQDRQLLSIGIFAWMLVGLVVFYAHLHVTGLIETQNDRNKYLNSEIAKLDKIIKQISNLKKRRKALVERMNVIYKLQADRTRMVHVLDELAQTLPDGVFYTSLKQKGNRLTLNGNAQSNARVSALMRNFSDSAWFANPNLKVVKAKGKGGGRVRSFTMSIVQRGRPKKNKKDAPGVKTADKSKKDKSKKDKSK